MLSPLSAQMLPSHSQQKVNLAQGAYRADDGNPYLLRAVAAAEATVAADVANGKLDHEYAGIEGLPDFIDAGPILLFSCVQRLYCFPVSSAYIVFLCPAQKFVFGGDCSALAAGRIAVRCPELQNRDTNSPMISDSSGVSGFAIRDNAGSADSVWNWFAQSMRRDTVQGLAAQGQNNLAVRALVG
eukprot:SAG31_NODE_845_length_11547_cov_8.098096_11_plen_185_part_00